jgi:hypothetical protein
MAAEKNSRNPWHETGLNDDLANRERRTHDVALDLQEPWREGELLPESQVGYGRGDGHSGRQWDGRPIGSWKPTD